MVTVYCFLYFVFGRESSSHELDGDELQTLLGWILIGILRHFYVHFDLLRNMFS